jgi:hypothetical protein
LIKTQLANQQYRSKAKNRNMQRRRQWNTTPQKTNNNEIEDTVENEVNEYLVEDPTRMLISMSNEHN